VRRYFLAIVEKCITPIPEVAQQLLTTKGTKITHRPGGSVPGEIIEVFSVYPSIYAWAGVGSVVKESDKSPEVFTFPI
jgi:hypothetical protein